jgi:hypothetical protein
LANAAGADDELHPAANSTAPIPTIPTAARTNLNILLRSLLVIVGIADTGSYRPSSNPGERAPGACLDQLQIT